MVHLVQPSDKPTATASATDSLQATWHNSCHHRKRIRRSIVGRIFRYESVVATKKIKPNPTAQSCPKLAETKTGWAIQNGSAYFLVFFCEERHRTKVLFDQLSFFCQGKRNGPRRQFVPFCRRKPTRQKRLSCSVQRGVGCTTQCKEKRVCHLPGRSTLAETAAVPTLKCHCLHMITISPPPLPMFRFYVLDVVARFR